MPRTTAATLETVARASLQRVGVDTLESPLPKAKTVDEYVAPLPENQRAALERLRRIIKSAAPRAEECISYQLPAFRLDGRGLVAFGAWKDHCAFYPMSSAAIAAHARELAAFETSKGTIRFQPNKPLTAAFIRKIVKARVAQNTRRHAAKVV